MSADEYRRAMDALARETTMSPESAARIERQLLAAISEREAADHDSSRELTGVGRVHRFGGAPARWRIWVPAAAALALVVGTLFVWRANQRPVTVPQQTLASEAPQKPTPVPPVDPAIEPPRSVKVTATHSAAPNKRPPKSSNVVTPSGFVDLPWTAGLPAFESGEIVRMDIPVASLPTYGIDISPAAGRGPVEADVLIGQDGFARQIRLVTTSSRSTQ